MTATTRRMSIKQHTNPPVHPKFVASKNDRMIAVDMSKINDDSIMSQCVNELKRFLWHPIPSPAMSPSPNPILPTTPATAHPQTNTEIAGTIMSATTTNKFLFRHLPPELRNTVYLEMVDPEVWYTDRRVWKILCRESRSYALSRFGQPSRQLDVPSKEFHLRISRWTWHLKVDTTGILPERSSNVIDMACYWQKGSFRRRS